VPQAIITAQVYFGSKALPQGQGVMAWQNLSDFASWFPQDYQIAGSNRSLGIAPIPFRGKSYVVSDDFDGKSLIVPMKYYEGPGVSLGAAKAQLSQAGEQYLSFDNKVTATLVRLKSFGTPARLRKFSPFWWDLPGLEFFAKEPFFADLAATTPAGFPIAQAGAVSPGTTVTTAIVYAGSVRTWPIFVLNVPVGNGVVINQFAIKNVMSGEILTITFSPPLAAATAYTVTVDCEAMTAQDQNGTQYDVAGSFPQLYGPAGQSQNIATTLVTASGTSTGVTVGCSFSNRWEV
jgi:hypothetical protein